VLFAHSLILWPQIPQIIYQLLFYVLAFVGVELFFVLSGFLIGSIIIKLFNYREDFNFKTAKAFWIRRWFRTLPNYYLVLASQLLIFYLITKSFPLSLLKFFVFSQNLTSGYPHFFYEAWTLSVEEWFYLLLPISYIAFKLLLPRKIDKKYIFLSVISFFLLFGIIARFIAATSGLTWQDIRGVVLFRIDSVMYGVLFAYACFHYQSVIEKYKKYLLYLGILLIFLCIGKITLDILNDVQGFFLKTFLFSFCSFGMACMLPAFNSRAHGRNPFVTKVATHLAIISYSAYLIHNSIVLAFLHEMPPFMGTYLIHYCMFWILTILCSTLLYKFFEKPVMSLRDKYRERT